jgi:hypothetical protein
MRLIHVREDDPGSAERARHDAWLDNAIADRASSLIAASADDRRSGLQAEGIRDRRAEFPAYLN